MLQEKDIDILNQLAKGRIAMKKTLGKLISVMLATAVFSLGSVGGMVSAATIDNEPSSDPIVTITIDGKSTLFPADGSDKALGRNEGPITVSVISQGDEPFAMEIEALADGTLVARRTIPASSDTNIEYMETETIYAKTIQDAKTEANRYGWAASWIECPAGIHNAQVKTGMEYYWSGTTVSDVQYAYASFSYNPVTWSLVSSSVTSGFTGPSTVWIDGVGTFDSWVPGDQYHTQHAKFTGLTSGYWSATFSITMLPALHTWHTDCDGGSL